MSWDSAGAVVAAWVLVPLLVTVLAAGLGELVGRVAGTNLGVMTVPAGFAAGIVVVTALLELGTTGDTAGLILAVPAATGVVLAVRRLGRPDRDVLLSAAGALAVYLVAMTPLVLGGRIGVLGYLLNNDSSVHLTAVELLAAYGTAPTGLPPSSFASVENLIGGGYPLGGYAWLLAAGAVTGIERLTYWTPLLAWHMALLALVAHALLVSVGVRRVWAAALGAIAACGYLTYAYYAQGGLKETSTAVCVYGFAAVLLAAPGNGRPWRRWTAAAVPAAAAFCIFGAGAGVWIAPIAVVGVLFDVSRRRWRRPSLRLAVAGGAALALLAVIAVPLAQRGIDFVNASDETLRNPAQAGNLLGPVPWRASLNIWFARDYRVLPPDAATSTDVGWILALALAVAGAAWVLSRKGWAITASVLAGAIGTYVITQRYSIYLDAKALAVLAPALGVLTAAGVWAVGSRHVVVRTVLTGAFAVGVVGSAVMVHRGVWISPEARFDEMRQINERFGGRGPMLVNEREQYSMYLMRDTDPWESWNTYQPERGFIEGEVFPEPPPHTPDFDDYRLSFVQRFSLLLERRRPGGSRPPSNYRPVFETTHYRVWERDASPPPVDHLGLGADDPYGWGRIDCADPRYRELVRRARTSGTDIVVREAGAQPVVVARPRDWGGYVGYPVPPPIGMITRFGGGSVRDLDLAPGRYTAWIQGQFGPGARLRVDGRLVGRVRDDLQSPDSWKSFGTVTVGSEPIQVYVQGAIERRWRPGSGHFDISGDTVFVRDAPPPGQRRVPASQAATLCGERVDWLELPA